MPEKKTSIPFPQERKWIREWKTCKHSELADCFHCIPKENEPALTRCTSFYLLKEEWEKMMDKNLPSIRIHMAIKREEGKDPAFIPIIQNFDKDSKEEGPFVCFSDKPPITPLSSVISKALKKELAKNWLYLHPGFIADQFETVKEVRENQKAEDDPRKVDKLIRQRVNFYFYGEGDVKKMVGISNTLEQVVFHMAVNHNDDRFGIPSFTPVLQFIYKNTNHSKDKVLDNESSNLFFEFASPCPNLCP